MDLKLIFDVVKSSGIDAMSFALAGFGIYGGNHIAGHPDNVRVVAEMVCNASMIIGVAVVGGNLLVIGLMRIVKNIRSIRSDPPAEGESVST